MDRCVISRRFWLNDNSHRFLLRGDFPRREESRGFDQLVRRIVWSEIIKPAIGATFGLRWFACHLQLVREQRSTLAPGSSMAFHLGGYTYARASKAPD